MAVMKDFLEHSFGADVASATKSAKVFIAKADRKKSAEGGVPLMVIPPGNPDVMIPTNAEGAEGLDEKDLGAFLIYFALAGN